MRALAMAFLLALLPGCGDDASGAPDAAPSIDAAPDPTVLRVAGQYPTVVALQQSSCSGPTVANMPTTVSHTAGETAVTLTHAGNSYTGTVARDGSFTTTPRAVGPASETHTLTIAGDFTTTGFTATVSVQVTTDGAPSCAYVVSWVGTRSGGPNVIPE